MTTASTTQSKSDIQPAKALRAHQRIIATLTSAGFLVTAKTVNGKRIPLAIQKAAA